MRSTCKVPGARCSLVATRGRCNRGLKTAEMLDGQASWLVHLMYLGQASRLNDPRQSRRFHERESINTTYDRDLADPRIPFYFSFRGAH